IVGLFCAVSLYAAAVLPTPMFVQPPNYLAFYPAYAAIILLLVGALATPFTNIPVSMPSGPFLFDPQGILGPIWPILFVAIACGAISGWHSLVSSSSSSKQLDVETDALPVGEGGFRVLGNKHVSSVVGLAIPWGFAVSGSWWALWLYFGGANQLLAGLAIMLITIHLAKVRAPSRYSLIPGVFMVVTTLAALV